MLLESHYTASKAMDGRVPPKEQWIGIFSVWPDKNCQMSIKVTQKWFH